MAKTVETSGDLLIQNTLTITECSCRVDPDHAEEVMGINMATTTQMKMEYGFRLKQAREKDTIDPNRG